MNHRRSNHHAVGLAIATVAVGVGAAAPARAGTATSSGPAVMFTDPAGVADRLAVSIESSASEVDADGIDGWRVSFLQYGPATGPGAGCREGFVATVCPTGPTPPATTIDLGGGNDELEVSTDPAFAGQRTAVAGGPGDDKLFKYQTGATIDGGPGDDLISPDDRFSVLDFPPAPTPGDVIQGGDGIDTVDYERVLDPIDVSLDGKANDGRKGEGDNVAADVENVLGARFGGTLSGSPRGNELIGSTGDDRLIGGAGRDKLSGLAGDDRIDALDGVGGDRVSCGDGADTASVDAGDILAGEQVAGGTACERVVTAPAVSGFTLRVRQRHVAVKLSCPTRATATCRGTVRLDLRNGKSLGRHDYRITRGRRATIRLKLRAKRPKRAVLLVAPRGTRPVAGRAVKLR